MNDIILYCNNNRRNNHIVDGVAFFTYLKLGNGLLYYPYYAGTQWELLQYSSVSSYSGVSNNCKTVD